MIIGTLLKGLLVGDTKNKELFFARKYIFQRPLKLLRNKMKKWRDCQKREWKENNLPRGTTNHIRLTSTKILVNGG